MPSATLSNPVARGEQQAGKRNRTMIAQIEQLLRETIGLDPAAVGRPMIAHAVRARMAAGGSNNIGTYWDQLRGSARELEELIEQVIVPETSFVRDRESFVALAGLMLAEWRPLHPAAQLRVLSAPCSTGEEPFSIAMALLDAGFSRESFAIDAVDISRRALSAAARASYDRNSFRHKDLAFRDRYFRPNGTRYLLLDSVRATVRFQHANLLTPDFLAGKCYDVIFCRNLLIYFDQTTRTRVVATIEHHLATDGYLFVGPSESSFVREQGFASTGRPRAFAHRRRGRDDQSPILPAPRPRRRAKAPAPLPAIPKADPVQPRETPAVDLDGARRLADAGYLTEAANACEAHLREHEASAAGYCLLGVLREALGETSRAAPLYRKALYLEPDHVEALTHLALLSNRAGDRALASRLQVRAQRAAQLATGQGGFA